LDAAPEPSGPASQHSELAVKLSGEAVRRAVLALPMRYREPVVLFYFHEMDVAAAAATMGLPEGTLKARLSRARTLLRQRFPQLDKDSHPGRKTKNAAGVGHSDFCNNEIAQETGKEAAR
jgi:RNA polymerase sigma-70 factor (ECF subfamily)